jgi:hypothetical protein
MHCGLVVGFGIEIHPEFATVQLTPISALKFLFKSSSKYDILYSMIPNKTGHKVISNIEGEKIAMGLDPDSTRHLMGLLTDAYNRPAEAVIREYATNAIDSHIAAGNPDPIRITLPTKDFPTLTIADQGVGLSKDDIRKIYSLYGASTKRETNDQAGTLGIGCKAALAYTDQFTIIAVKDEVRTTVSIARDEDGGGTMTIVSEEEAAFVPNGVEVIVPADPNAYDEEDDFGTLAKNLFAFWPEGSVLVDGKAPKRFAGGIKVTDDIIAYKNYEADSPEESHIVMGNVPYKQRFAGMYTLRLVATVPNGAVDFPTSREGLRDTERTREVLRGIRKTFVKEARRVVQEAIEKAGSKNEALKTYLAHQWLLTDSPKSSDFTWRGETLPERFLHQHRFSFTLLKQYKPNRKEYGKANVDTAGSVGVGRAVNGLWITGYTNANWNGLNRDRMDAFVADKINKGELPADTKVSLTTITELPEVPSSDWLDPTRIFSWKEEVKKFRMSGPKAKAYKTPGTYPVWANGYVSNNYLADDINREAPVFYDRKADTYSGDHEHYYKDLEEAYPGTQVVLLTPNREAKFQRDFPEAKPVYESLRELAKKWWNDLTDQEEKAIKAKADPGLDTDFFHEEDVELILDPDLRESFVLNKLWMETETRLLSFLPNEQYNQNDNEDESIDFEARYPLLADTYRARSNGFQEHALNYVNWAYAQHITNGRKS